MTTNAAAEATARKTAATAPKKPAAKRPATAKAPQDHKPAMTAETEATKVTTVTATASGREWQVNVSAMDDFEIMEHMLDMDEGGAVAVAASAKVLRAVLTRQEHREALELLRDSDTGVVSLQAGYGFAMELMASLNPNS